VLKQRLKNDRTQTIKGLNANLQTTGSSSSTPWNDNCGVLDRNLRIACTASATLVFFHKTLIDQILNVAQCRVMGTLRQRGPFRRRERSRETLKESVQHGALASVDRGLGVARFVLASSGTIDNMPLRSAIVLPRVGFSH
jgi:hypothetical protein